MESSWVSEVPSRILIVDDNRQNVELLKTYISAEGYEVDEAYDGEEALSKVTENPPDLILLDIMMPKVNGYDVCARLKADEKTRFIPVIMVTALSDLEDKIKGLDAGTDDFISKPFNRHELLARVRSLLRIRHYYADLDHSQDIIITLALAVEAKDPYTRGHSERVADFAQKLAKALGLSVKDQDIVHKAGLLHDIGKIGVSESYLHKPGPLSREEREIIRDHPVRGEAICQPLKSLKHLLPAIRHHHERYNGTGYPDGLKGEEIPLMARILAIADIYDALTSDRPYRVGLPNDKAMDILKSEADQQYWDPAIVHVLVDCIKEKGRL
ncbi:MAG: response regulator [Nitrospirota bacterium]|nr:response regulator [Nitrospirota bacterium]